MAKVRNGFVSNSSSSSFIIGIAVIPPEKLEETKAKFPHDVRTVLELMSEEPRSWGRNLYSPRYDRIEIESFTGQSESIDNVQALVNKDNNAHILYIRDSGYEPDYNESSGEYNYDDVDLDREWFSESQLELANTILDFNGDVSVGGGYNG